MEFHPLFGHFITYIQESVYCHKKGEPDVIRKIVSEVLPTFIPHRISRQSSMIDPRRDCDIYLKKAIPDELVITHIFETHRNEDYTIVRWNLPTDAGLPFITVKKWHFPMANLSGRVRPLFLDRWNFPFWKPRTHERVYRFGQDREVSDQPYMVFCGDTLFAGDIARTDFFGKITECGDGCKNL